MTRQPRAAPRLGKDGHGFTGDEMTLTMAESTRDDTASTLRATPDHIFYPALAILISTIGFGGFAFTYFGRIISGSYPPAGFPLHLHGWSFFLWYLLFPLQAVLIARGKYAHHRTLGSISVALVALMAFTGILVLTVRVEEALRNGAPQVWLLYGPLFLSNLILFVTFYSGAILMATRNRFQAHKRLMIVAAAVGMGAGFARVIMFVTGFHPLSIPAGTLGCAIFIIIGMCYDRWIRRAVHPAYWIGFLALLLVETTVLPQVNSGAVAWINQGLAAIGDEFRALYQPHPTVEF
jgi:hypothetical protein